METVEALLNNPVLLVSQLRRGLHDLPGEEAQLRMAPGIRTLRPEPGVTPRASAVLLALYLNEGQLNLLFTRRQASLQHHSGEISFPGGGREAQDADLVETALREAQEEVGLLPPSVRVLGELTPLYIPPSRNLVHPIVGWVRGRPKFVINPGEVDCVIEVPVRRLLQPETVHEFTWHREGETYAAPCYRHNGDCIWGATAMILSEFLVLLERIARASAASRALEGP